MSASCRRFRRDSRGQAMAEYVILSAIMVGCAAYLYHPNNELFRAFRSIYDRQSMVVGYPGP
jgi:Flp pilus assembly pilin Flp